MKNTAPIDSWTGIHFVVGVLIALGLFYAFSMQGIALIGLMFVIGIVWEAIEPAFKRLKKAGGRETIDNMAFDVLAVVAGGVVVQILIFWGVLV